MSNPKISIIIPVLNRAELIKETVDSILAQTLREWEVIIVDDHSSDNTLRVIKGLAKQNRKIKAFKRTAAKSGSSACRNEGLDNATGDYVIFFDSDDILMPHALEHRYNDMTSNPTLDFSVYNGLYFKYNPGDSKRLIGTPSNCNTIDLFLSMDYPWGTPGPIWKKSFLVTNKLGFNERFLSWLDLEFSIKALACKPNYRQDYAPDYYVRRSPQHSSLSTISHRLPAHLESRKRLFESIYELLEKKNLQNRFRRKLFARLFVALAEEWAKIGDRPEAFSLWRHCVTHKIVNHRQYVLGYLAIFAANSGKVHKNFHGAIRTIVLLDWEYIHKISFPMLKQRLRTRSDKAKHKSYFILNQKLLPTLSNVSNPSREKLFRKVANHTMVSRAGLINVYKLSQSIEKEQIQGDLIECGCWKGGCAAIMAHLSQKAKSNRKTVLFDSFVGLPEPGIKDGEKAWQLASWKFRDQLQTINQCVAKADDAKNIMESLGIRPKNVVIKEGWFENTMPKTIDHIDAIAILRLDADWYKPTKFCLEHLYDKVTPGGYVVIDDYGCWEGCRKAVDEFLAARKLKTVLHTVDKAVVYFKKPLDNNPPSTKSDKEHIEIRT